MITLLLLIVGLATGYHLKCPVQAEWSLRANISCYSKDKYVCLFNLLEIKYEESCLGPDRSSIGSKLVFQPLFNLAECNTGRYQPIVFTTHGNSDCIFQKSKCSEEGQVVFHNGTSDYDIACRCDYTKGYAFVSKPNNTCFCEPFKEDCSCYKENCMKLSPDYRCINDEEITPNIKCQEIHPQISYITNNNMVQYIERNRQSYFHTHHIVYFIIASLTVCIVLQVLTGHVFVPPKFLSQQIIESDGRNIGITCCVRSYLPLTSVIHVWRTDPGENTCMNVKNCLVSRYKGIRTLTFKTSEDFDTSAYKCIASNIIGIVESNPVQLNDDDRQKFIHELFLKGECGKLHFARLVFIGKNGVGKTSLMRRLLWQNKEDVTASMSTDGIEIEKCNISIIDGKWSPCDTKDDDLTRLIQQVYKGRNQHFVKIEAVDQLSSGFNTDVINSESNIKKFRNSNGRDAQYIFDEDIDSKNSDYTAYFDSNGANNHYLQSEKVDNNEPVWTSFDQTRSEIIKFENKYERNESSNESEIDSNPINDENINKMTSRIIESLQIREKDQGDMVAFCWLWDFAGQKDFYATHQVFLSKCAVYLLVTDSLKFSTAEKPGVNFEDSAEYVRFWFDVIHCYWSTRVKGRLDPPIIVVCTHEDKFKEPYERQKRQKEFEDNLSRILKEQKKKQHLRNIYFVSNTEDADVVFEEIRNEISRHAMNMQGWGKDCPLKWLLFQQVLLKLKDSDVPVSSTETLLKIAKCEDIGIIKDDDVKQCLQYCHDIGTVVYFDGDIIGDHVILDPKWLVDVFRCLISDKIENVIKVSDDWQKLTETGELTDSLICRLFKKEPKLKCLENKTHVIEVMKRFDIIVKLKNSTALYMPCMMEACSFSEVEKHFIDGNQSFNKTSWLCLEFDFLPPAFFNHILAWYISQYYVSDILVPETRTKRNALYRHIGVFNLDLTGCEKLVVCEAPNIIALQVWNCRTPDVIDRNLGSRIFEFVNKLSYRYKLHISFIPTFKCKHGDFSIDRKKMKEILTEDYFCLEHKKAHRSIDLVAPWNLEKELNKTSKTESVNHFVANPVLPNTQTAAFGTVTFSNTNDMDYVYRLQRPGESFANGIKAKNPDSLTSVFTHVVYGSFGPTSQYISTCGSLKALMNFASKSRSPGKIIKIGINKLPADVGIIDLRDYSERMEYIDIINNKDNKDDISKFHNFAHKFEEVLLSGYIPNSCIQLVENL